MKVWMERTLSGCRASDEESLRVLNKFDVGVTFEADVITRKPRSSAWHRRYWALMSMLASHVERVEIEPGVTLEIHNADDAHTAIKYCTGLYDSFVLEGGGVIRLLKSTAFDRMDADEWVAYWSKVLDAVHQKFLPRVELHDIEMEILRCCGEAS